MTRTTGTAKCWRVRSMQQVSIPSSVKRSTFNLNPRTKPGCAMIDAGFKQRVGRGQFKDARKT